MPSGDYFDHISALDGSTPHQRVKAAGAQPGAVAENIACGQESPQEVVDGWLHPSGHCRNIMGDFSLIGLSAVGGGEGPYWTQVFALP
ncbi:CAP domain-containing protein [Deinococcus humi]|uniref:CAP domain-containing protein n=1 Tax=Deinococcus humi TaxID=662880 RepID=UPI001E499DAA|nr:CAP domain-containing protein [Deinococcus humi]